MKLSLAITNYNRTDMLLESFERVLKDDRIAEIVISDDCSSDDVYRKLWTVFEEEKYSKVKLFRNGINIGMSLNKRKVVSLCSYPHAILFDSDNILSPSYIDALERDTKGDLNWATFYMPDWAMDTFDYRAFAGIAIDKNNVKEYLDKPMYEQNLNTCNMVVPVDYYLSVYENNPEIKETDSLYMNYLWLKWGGDLYVVPGMRYIHKIHSGSGWLSNAAYNIQKGEEIKKLIREL